MSGSVLNIELILYLIYKTKIILLKSVQANIIDLLMQRKLARVVSVPVDQHSGGQLATKIIQIVKLTLFPPPPRF